MPGYEDLSGSGDLQRLPDMHRFNVLRHLRNVQSHCDLLEDSDLSGLDDLRG